MGFRIAVRMLKDKVVGALGAGSQIAELKVGWNSVELVGLDIAAPKGWPAARTLQAERVTIVPSRVLKNPPFALRHAQDERRIRGKN